MAMTQPKEHAATAASPSPLAAYEGRVAAGALKSDAGQRRAAERLDALYQLILGHSAAQRRSLMSRLFGREVSTVHGLYLYGQVGRGKSMLMDAFFASLPIKNKRRVHFHAFMLDVHKRLHAFRQSGTHDDVLPRVVTEIANETQVLCLDEFQVSDVTDAMILSRLFTGLFAEGVWVIMTSNRHPRDLYQGGLQRDQFLQFVALAEVKLEIHSLDSPHDYRLQQLQAMQSTYFYPLGEAADGFLLESWNALTGHETSRRLDIHVQGRVLRIDKHYSGVAWLTFDELCARALGANDYLELATLCHTVLLQNIPAMKFEDRNEAKRFVTLIDALYEHKVKLICTAVCVPDALYPSGDGSFEFQRTVSRLIEMQSASYLALPHLG